MTIEDIFNKLASHMIEGIMYHDEFANAYAFLGLYGFAKCHDYHHLEETKCYRNLQHYYSSNFHKLLSINDIPRPQIIPDNWSKYNTMEVDVSTKKNSVQSMMKKWIEWERETKQLYQQLRAELTALGEIAAGLYIDKLICEVSEELKHAEKSFIKMETIGYDIGTIVSW